MSSRRRITIALVGLVVLAVVGWLAKDLSGQRTAPTSPVSSSAVSSESGLSVRAMSTLPAEVASTYHLIITGGPFPYPSHDGVVFDNREKRLPVEQPGYYHEYTVPTPGYAGRGARRLISGARHELYYTGDHYSSFVVVDSTR